MIAPGQRGCFPMGPRLRAPTGSAVGGRSGGTSPRPTPTPTPTHSALSIRCGSSPLRTSVNTESVAKNSLKAIGPIHRFSAADELTQSH